MKKLAIITTHPIQYNAPFFRLLTERGRLRVKVFYTWSQAKDKINDKLFKRTIQWDIPLLDGYEYKYVENISSKPGTNKWTGIINPDLIPQIKLWQPDAVLVFGWHLKSHFSALRYFHSRIPVLFRGDSTLLDEKSDLKKVLRRFWLKQVYRHVDKALYVGQNNKNYFKVHGIREADLIYAPHAIDNERFGRESKYSNDLFSLREEYRIKEKDFVILYAGKFEPRKNLKILINAVNILIKKSEHKFKLILAGNGPLEDDLREQALMNPNIIFMPFQNQSLMPAVYRLANVFCLPSISETWGLAVNESLASGRPVLISDKVGCGPDLITNSKLGLIFKHDSLDDLADKIGQMVAKKDQYQKNKEYIKQQISAWNFERICTAIEKAVLSNE